MLVHKFKSKKPTAYSQNKLNPFFNQDELGDLAHAHDTLEDDRYVDEKYRDFHRRRQSEKVLNVIRSVLGDNNESLHKLTSAQTANKSSKSVLNSSKKESSHIDEGDSLGMFTSTKKESPRVKDPDAASISTITNDFTKKEPSKDITLGGQIQENGISKGEVLLYDENSKKLKFFYF